MTMEQDKKLAALLAAKSEDLEASILEVIAREGMISADKLTADATLESLGLSSLDVVHILLGIEDKYGVYLPLDESLEKTKNIGELIMVLSSQLAEKSRAS
jgi:acyl carrier protein